MSEGKPLRSGKDRADQADHHNLSVAQELKTMNERINGMHTSLGTMLDEKLKAMNSTLEKNFNKKVDNLRDSLTKIVMENTAALKQEMETKTKQIQDNMDMDIGLMVTRLERLEGSAQSAADMKRSKFDIDVSITVAGLPFEDGEEATERVKRLLTDVLKCDPMPSIVNAERLKPRGSGPGLIKAELGSTEEKVAVLRRKQRLREEEGYSRVYIHSAKSHAERLIELNFRTLLREIPKGKDFYMTGNGRLVKRDGGERNGRGGAERSGRAELEAPPPTESDEEH